MSMQLLASEVPPGIVSLLMFTIAYIQAMALYTQGRFNNHTECSLYRIMVMATSVRGEMNMGNCVPRPGIEPTYLAFLANFATISPHRLPDVTGIPTQLLASEVGADYYIVILLSSPTAPVTYFNILFCSIGSCRLVCDLESGRSASCSPGDSSTPTTPFSQLFLQQLFYSFLFILLLPPTISHRYGRRFR